MKKIFENRIFIISLIAILVSVFVFLAFFVYIIALSDVIDISRNKIDFILLLKDFIFFILWLCLIPFIILKLCKKLIKR